MGDPEPGHDAAPLVLRRYYATHAPHAGFMTLENPGPRWGHPAPKELVDLYARMGVKGSTREFYAMLTYADKEVGRARGGSPGAAAGSGYRQPVNAGQGGGMGGRACGHQRGQGGLMGPGRGHADISMGKRRNGERLMAMSAWAGRSDRARSSLTSLCAGSSGRAKSVSASRGTTLVLAGVLAPCQREKNLNLNPKPGVLVPRQRERI
jgi:hypothetical protein